MKSKSELVRERQKQQLIEINRILFELNDDTDDDTYLHIGSLKKDLQEIINGIERGNR